jgi:hypothetical protein
MIAGGLPNNMKPTAPPHNNVKQALIAANAATNGAVCSANFHASLCKLRHRAYPSVRAASQRPKAA